MTAPNFNLHSLGWSSFQQLCLTICREVLGQTVQSFLDSNDAGRDGAFAGTWTPKEGLTYSGQFVIQCKFSAKAGARLTKTGISAELPKVRALVADGLCDIYVLMTNAGVSAKQEAQMRASLIDAGAKDVLVLTGTWIEDQIRHSPRLRTLVPRIYGLGDLSQILDERAYAQARAVLEGMREDLAKVVITQSYRRAVEALDTHGFVLLIGEPASGKTTIASMLAMASADMWKSSVIKLADPGKVVDRWNVNEPSQFFWVDDAFGTNQYESPLVQGWNHNLVEVRAMLRKGVKIVMTSRDYIYNRARDDLKESTFPLLSESQVVIDVHDLTDVEKKQILYNHLKLGSQPKAFRKGIKPELDHIASHERFIPETARRLADPFFTTKLYLSRYFLDDFVEKREQLLLEVIQKIDAHSKAALGLIYMRKDRLESPIVLQGAESQALERLGSTIGQCITALQALAGSLVTHTQIDDQSVWRFKHPTIGDAYATTLSFSPELLGIFLVGSSTDSLMAQITCGSVGLEKAVIVPKSLYPDVIARLTGFTHSDVYKVEWFATWGARWSLHRFLARRCSKDFLSMYLQADPAVLDLVSKPRMSLNSSAEVGLAVRLHEFGLLPEEHRRTFVETVSKYALAGDDQFALESDGIRTLFTDAEFDELVQAVRTDLLPNLAAVRLAAEKSHASDRTAEEHMEPVRETMRTLSKRFADDEDALKIIRQQSDLTEEWITQAEEPEPKVSPRALGAVEPSEDPHSTRSIFDDIDED